MTSFAFIAFLLLLVLFALCVCASCFFSGSETALTTLSDAAVFRMKEKKHPEAVTQPDLEIDDPPRHYRA